MYKGLGLINRGVLDEMHVVDSSEHHVITSAQI